MIFLQFGPSCLGPSCKTSLSCKLASCNQLLVELTQKMPKPFSHQDCREKVCCCCGLRTVKKKKVSEAEELLVRKYAKPEFDSNLREQPCGLCSTCRWYLYACKREERWDDIGRQDPRLRWDAFHLEHSRFREKDHDSDICHVCLLAKWNPVDNPEKRDLMRPTEEMCPEERQKVYKFCTDCYQHIGKGISHKCTSANAKRNLANIVMNLARNDKEQVVAECLTDLTKSSSDEAAGGSGLPAGPVKGELNLNRLKGGKRLSVTVGKIPAASKPKPISTGFMASIQKKLGLSEFKILLLAREFKKEGVNFEAHLREELQALSHSLDSFFEVEKLEFLGKDKDNGDVPVMLDLVYLTDTEAFISYIIGERDLDPEKAIVRVGLDGGQGSFKVVASIFETGPLQKDSPGELLTGANKLLVFALSEGMAENYHDIRIVVEKLGLADLPCVFASDLKVINALLGISSHSGKHGCAYCDGEMSLEGGELRTFANLAMWHQRLKEDAERSNNPAAFIKKNQKYYKNVVNPCLLKADDPDTTILSTVPLPELHLLMGLVNWALELLYKFVPKEELVKRMRTKSISVHGYHGGGLDGNNSSNFLANLDWIFDPMPENLQPVHTMLTRFKKVVESCFSMDLAESFRQDIDLFNESVFDLIQYCAATLDTTLKPTWKVHILVVHLKPFLEEKMVGLGVFCEQTGEAAHAVMKPTEKRFKTRIDHPDHGNNMMRAATDFTAKNV